MKLYESNHCPKSKFAAGFRYLRHKQTKYKTWWRCEYYKIGCQGWGYENNDGFTLTRSHNHGPDPLLLMLERELFIENVNGKIVYKEIIKNIVNK